jgi:thymidylate synthase (FAD)
MFLLCFRTAPSLFRNAGPACLRGKCPEGEKSCGKAAEIREKRNALIESGTEEKE